MAGERLRWLPVSDSVVLEWAISSYCMAPLFVEQGARLTTRWRYAINLEPEFASVLNAASGEISTLSPNVRSAGTNGPSPF